MNLLNKNFADKKWFVPIVLIVMTAIALSSFSLKKDTATHDDAVTQLKSICAAVTGTDSVNVMIVYEDASSADFWTKKEGARQVSGVAVICDGGDDPEIKLKIYDIVKSLFGISTARISVNGSGI